MLPVNFFTCLGCFFTEGRAGWAAAWERASARLAGRGFRGLRRGRRFFYAFGFSAGSMGSGLLFFRVLREKPGKFLLGICTQVR